MPVCKELLKAVDDWGFQRHGLAFGNVGACLLQATDFIREQRLRVYCILAGLLLWEGPPVINTCCGMDWKRALALHLWSVSNTIIMQGCFIQNLYTPWQIRLLTERMVLWVNDTLSDCKWLFYKGLFIFWLLQQSKFSELERVTAYQFSCLCVNSEHWTSVLCVRMNNLMST